jgi:flagellar hook-basal body complex protein FliE
MAILPIGAALPALPTLPTVAPVDAVGAPGTTTAASGTGNGAFANAISSAIDNLQSVQSKADTLAVKAATGDLTDVHDYMIAATKASIATQLTVAVRNKAVEAFNDIMKMPV